MGSECSFCLLKFWLENIGKSKKESFLIARAMSKEMKVISCNGIRISEVSQLCYFIITMYRMFVLRF